MKNYRTTKLTAEDDNSKVSVFVETVHKGGLTRDELVRLHTAAVSRAMQGLTNLPYQHLEISEIKKRGR